MTEDIDAMLTEAISYMRKKGQNTTVLSEALKAIRTLRNACEMALEDLEPYEHTDLPGGYAVMQTVHALRAATEDYATEGKP